MNSLRSSVFVETLEHRRFTEFCDACSRYCYIGLCYGAPGVGKTLSAGRYSRWDIVKQIDPWRKVRSVSVEALTGLNTIFYTPPIINTPRQIEDDIQRLRDRLQTSRLRTVKTRGRPATETYQSARQRERG